MAWTIESTEDEKFPYLINDEKGELVAKIAMATKTKVQETGLGFAKASDYKEEDMVKTDIRAEYIALVPRLMDIVTMMSQFRAYSPDGSIPLQPDDETPEWVKAAEKTGAHFIPDN